jgi:hypothetical protein
MYLTRSLRVIAPALLGIFSVALPASANTVNTSVRAMHTPTIVGLCNLTFVSPLTRGEQRMNLILENGNGGYSALLPGRSSTVSLDAVTFDGTTLRASASTTAGTGHWHADHRHADNHDQAQARAVASANTGRRTSAVSSRAAAIKSW